MQHDRSSSKTRTHHGAGTAPPLLPLHVPRVGIGGDLRVQLLARSSGTDPLGGVAMSGHTFMWLLIAAMSLNVIVRVATIGRSVSYTPGKAAWSVLETALWIAGIIHYWGKP